MRMRLAWPIFADSIMGTFTTIAQLLTGLAILITLHELGHYLAARAFGIRVEKFYLFFDAWGFKLFKFKKGDTEYGIGWLPLGGYVKIAGMVDESLDKDQMKKAPEPWEFRSKPAWQRLIVMIGGVTVNLILGIGIAVAMLYAYGEKYVPNEVINSKGGIYASPEARQVGLMHGDKILKLNGKPVENLLREMSDPDFIMAGKKEILLNRNGKDTTILLPEHMEEILGKKSELPFVYWPVQFKVKSVVGGSAADKAGIKAGDMIAEVNGKNSQVFYTLKELLMDAKGKTATLTVVTPSNGTKKVDAAIGEDGTLGFQPELFGFEKDEKKISYGFGESLSKGVSGSFSQLGATARGLGKVVTGKVSAKKSISGPIGIAQAYGPKWNWFNFWTLTSMLSLVLALMNILPIPALDGGHVMFLLWEIVTGRPVNEKVLYVGQIIGMVLLLALIVFTFWVDIAKLLHL
ncbi:MAG: RIP metalloprotease RseP [Bacteroidetes bacterium]|nr:RIP metalloprotease RseP [Bacteroidota bacterium]